MESVYVSLASLDDTVRLGQVVGRLVEPGDIVYLNGELGAGKTTLVKSIAAALGIPESAVTSPTFNLVHEYTSGRLPLYHLDIYRLSSPEELTNLAFDDMVSDAGAVMIVEWADRAVEVMPLDALTLQIVTHTGGVLHRSATLSAGGERSNRLLRQIKISFQC